MAPELWQLFLVAVAYLGVLFLVAYAAEEGWLPAWIARHPLTYTLSLGVYATTWSYYGSVGFAATQGYLFLTIYLGVTLAFLLAPVLLAPLLRLVREHQLTSLADLFAFRYPSRFTGVLVTLFMLAGILPYISLQIQAVTTSVRVLTQVAPPQVLALVFCSTVTLFAVLFGARKVTPREKHDGLVVAIAFESAVKLVALLAVGLFAVFGVFGGPGAMQAWLDAHPEAMRKLYEPMRDGAWPTLLLLAFSAAFLLPRQFHMVFVENMSSRSLRVASWAFPLFLLLLNLAIPPILWAGQALAVPGSADYYVLAVTLHADSVWLTLFTFIGGISAASAMIIVESLALASMTLNHLILPVWLARRPGPDENLYRRLLWARRILIVLIIFTGYGTFVAVQHTQELAQLGLISFVAVTQFLPAILGMLAWKRATRVGFLAGVSGGMLVWFATLVWPLIGGAPLAPLEALPLQDLDRWERSTFLSLSVNALLFIVGSLLSRPISKEIAADQACRLSAVLYLPEHPRLASPADLERTLTDTLGKDAARAEVAHALAELGLPPGERRPRQLLLLQERIERNLSGLLGPQLAHGLLALPESEHNTGRPLLIEDRLENTSRLYGLAAELNELRRFHRQMLRDLPMGVCSLGPAQEIAIWNDRMAELSGVPADAVVGLRLAELPAPWDALFRDFLGGTVERLYKVRADIAGRSRWLNLYKEVVATPQASAGGARSGVVLLVEDLTDQQQLEAELVHSERLASIGILAAGVAHEIGNPLTGITSLAQNMRDEADPREIERGMRQILEQSRRINEIVRSLLNFSHAGAQREVTRFALADCVAEAISLVRLSPNGRQLNYETRVPAALALEADRPRLTQVLVNLLTNAVDASPAGARIEVTAQELGSEIVLQICDEGHGIPESLRARVFEPFFTTKDPGRGTGLGLPLVHGIVRDHGGTMSLDSREPGGTTVTIRLPACAVPSEAAA